MARNRTGTSPTLYRQATFVLGISRIAQLPPDEGAEVAFAGRSNAGKSSAINAITDQKALARTSKTPGRTQQINFFQLTERKRLVDLPGYGYAKAPSAVQQRWAALVERYLQQRGSLKGVVTLMDVRRPFTALDEQLLAWCQAARIPVHILLTKADKLSRGQAAQALLAARRLIEPHAGFTVQLFSATNRTGIEEAQARLDEWLR